MEALGLLKPPRSDMRVARLLASACIALYLVVFTVIFFMGTANGSSPSQMIALTLGSHADPVEYQMLAENMINQHRFAMSPDAPDEFARVPGYPAFLAVILLIFHTMLVVPVIQIVLTASAVALIYLIGVRYFSRPIAIFAAAVYMIDPIVMFATFWPLSETLFVLLFFGSIYALGASSKRTWLPFLVAGILLGLSTYVRHAGLYLAPIIACIPLFRATSWRAGLRNAGIFLAAAVIVTTPWFMRNYSLSGHFAFSSLREWQTFLNMSNFEQAKTGVPYQIILSEYETPLGTTDEHLLRQFTYADKLSVITHKVLFAHPFQYLFFLALTSLKVFISSSLVIVTYHMHQVGILAGNHAQGDGAWGMLVKHQWKDALVQIFTHIPRLIERIFLGLMYISALCVAAIAVVKQTPRSVWIICIFLMINLYAATIGPASDDTKYRIPIEPFMFLLGGYGVSLLWPRIRKLLRIEKTTLHLPLAKTR